MNKYELTEQLDALEELLQEATDKANELASMTQGVFAGQLKGYLAATLRSFITNEYQPGSIASLRDMIDDACEEEDEEE